MNKKAELSIAFVASITLAILGFFLVMLFLTQTTNGKAFYCNNIEKYTEKIGISREDVCSSLKKLETVPGTPKVRNISLFPNNNDKELFNVNATRTESFSLNLSKDSRIQSAEVKISNANPLTYITRFNDQDFVTVLTFDFTGGSNFVYVNVTPDVIVSRARLKVEGYNVPGRLDLVFVIDQSKSMYNEWDAICGVIDDLKDNLSKTGLGVDVVSTIYGLSENGGTFRGCRDSVIKNAALDQAISAIGIQFPKESPVLVPGSSDTYDYPPYNRYDEAWALGIYWTATGHSWRNSTKKIAFPVSDSDPTGGGPGRLKTQKIHGKQTIIQILADAKFSGNEADSVDAAKQASDAKGIYLFPIYGDEASNETDLAKIEGYHVGTGSTTCDPNIDLQCGCDIKYSQPPYDNVCQPIIDWMRFLTLDASGSLRSRLSAYRNKDDLKKFAQFILATNYPRDVTIKVNGTTIFSIPGPLDNINSPLWVNETLFIAALEQASQECNKSTCQIPIEVSSAGEGAVVLSELEIIFQQYAKDVEVKLNGNSIFYQNKLAGTENIDFTNQARSEIDLCAEPECIFNFTISAMQPEQILLSNLSIRYSKIFVEEDLLLAVLECYEKAKADNFGHDLRCTEIPVPPSYIFYREINESSLTWLIKSRKWCGIFQNFDYGCGNDDQLRFAHTFNEPTNILVEYDSKSRQVMVS
ncbi:MAG TPA: hypothetical protein VJB90_02135 [Candidatus Nanoarchaeia archaeon]|nr:hypothetical protein [Candidatus Nanoarchaeia archaeon]